MQRLGPCRRHCLQRERIKETGVVLGEFLVEKAVAAVDRLRDIIDVELGSNDALSDKDGLVLVTVRGAVARVEVKDKTGFVSGRRTKHSHDELVLVVHTGRGGRDLEGRDKGRLLDDGFDHGGDGFGLILLGKKRNLLGRKRKGLGGHDGMNGRGAKRRLLACENVEEKRCVV